MICLLNLKHPVGMYCFRIHIEHLQSTMMYSRFMTFVICKGFSLLQAFGSGKIKLQAVAKTSDSQCYNR